MLSQSAKKLLLKIIGRILYWGLQVVSIGLAIIGSVYFCNVYNLHINKLFYIIVLPVAIFQLVLPHIPSIMKKTGIGKKNIPSLKIIGKIFYWGLQVLQCLLVFIGLLYICDELYPHIYKLFYLIILPVTGFLFLLPHRPSLKRSEIKNRKMLNNSEEYFAEYNADRSKLFTPSEDNILYQNINIKNVSNDIFILILLIVTTIIAICVLPTFISKINIIDLLIFTLFVLFGLFLLMLLTYYSIIINIKFIDDKTVELSTIKQKIQIEIDNIQSINLTSSSLIIRINNKNNYYYISGNRYLGIIKAILSRCDAEIGTGLKIALYKDKLAKEKGDDVDEE